MIYKKIINRILKLRSIVNIPSHHKNIYLTFDDGPEDGITEFVLSELDKYGFKATFFCRGDNAEKHPELLQLLRDKGHAIGNHTYGHLHAYDSSAQEYAVDVAKADAILNTRLMRPPHGSLSFRAWWKIRKYKIVYWALNSEDSSLGSFNYAQAINHLKSKTSPGDVILFHFCHRHENETRQILPSYLSWLHEQGFRGLAIDEH